MSAADFNDKDQEKLGLELERQTDEIVAKLMLYISKNPEMSEKKFQTSVLYGLLETFQHLVFSIVADNPNHKSEKILDKFAEILEAYATNLKTAKNQEFLGRIRKDRHNT